MNKLRVAFYGVRRPMKVIEIEHHFQAMQQLIGSPIEAVHLTDELLIVCNEEGLWKGLEQNRLEIVGPFFIVREATEAFGSLTDSDIEFLRRNLK